MTALTFYCIRHKETHDLVRVSSGSWCGEDHHSLIENDSFPVWHVSDINFARTALKGENRDHCVETGAGDSYEFPLNDGISPDTHEVVEIKMVW